MAWTLGWTVGLVALVRFYQLLNWPEAWDDWSLAWRLWHHVASIPINASVFLSFSAFAGGLAAWGKVGQTGVVGRALAVAVISFGLGAYLHPIAQYHQEVGHGLDVEARDPWGPRTPGALRAQREHIEANPPEEYSYRIGDPYGIAPNWLTTQIHARIAVPAFAIFSALLGWWIAGLTSGLPPPARRNARWFLGLAVVLSFFVPMYIGAEWVRGGPDRSGIWAAWGAMLVPLAELGLLVAIPRLRRGPEMPAMGSPGFVPSSGEGDEGRHSGGSKGETWEGAPQVPGLAGNRERTHIGRGVGWSRGLGRR